MKDVFIHKEEAEGTSMTNGQWSIIPARRAGTENTANTDHYWPILSSCRCGEKRFYSQGGSGDGRRISSNDAYWKYWPILLILTITALMPLWLKNFLFTRRKQRWREDLKQRCLLKILTNTEHTVQYWSILNTDQHCFHAVVVKDAFIHKEEAEGTSMTNGQWSIIPAPGARSEYTEYTDQYWLILPILTITDNYWPLLIITDQSL